MVLHLPYLLQVQAILLNNLSVEDTLPLRSASPPPVAARKAPLAHVGSKRSPPNPPECVMKLSITLEQPDIALVHDTSTHCSPAIVLHVSTAHRPPSAPHCNPAKQLILELYRRAEQSVARCYRTLPDVARCCRTLPDVATRCQMLPHVARCCQMLPDVATYC